MGMLAEAPARTRFDMQAELERWVERGIPPEEVIATQSPSLDVVDRLRPLCPYPQIATYKGQGDTNDEVNFVCRDPKQQESEDDYCKDLTNQSIQQVGCHLESPIAFNCRIVPHHLSDIDSSEFD